MGVIVSLMVAVAGLAGAPAAAAATGGWSLQTPPGLGAGESAQLSAVSCTTGGFCAAVGSSSTPDQGGSGALAAVRRGGAWSIVPVPLPSGAIGGSLSGVSCTSDDACLAVGQYVNAVGYPQMLAEQWTGSGWTAIPPALPSGTQQSALDAVSCSSGDACTAVGGLTPQPQAQGPSPQTAVERWDGSGWSAQTAPDLGGAAPAAVACPSDDACVAVGGAGNTRAAGWNGSSWTATALPVPADAALTGVSCSSDDACTAVGYTAGQGASATVAVRLGAAGWSAQAPPSPDGQGSRLLAVSCPSATACTAGGYAQAILAAGWNGAAWSVQSTPDPADAAPDVTPQLLGVSCAGTVACVAVGDYETVGGLTLPVIEAGPAAGGGSPGGGSGSSGPSGSSPGSSSPGSGGGRQGAPRARPAAVATVGRGRVRGLTVTVPVRCAGRRGAHCRVRLMLSVTELLTGGHLRAVAADRVTRRMLVLAARTVRLRAGDRRLVTLTVGRAGRRLLARTHSRLTVALTFST